MRQLFFGIISTAFFFALSSCTDDADPQFRIRNDRSDKANVQIKTTGGNTININDVQPGQTTTYQSAAEGNIVTTAVIQNESVAPTMTFFAGIDTRSTIVIQTGTVPSLRVDH